MADKPSLTLVLGELNALLRFLQALYICDPHTYTHADSIANECKIRKKQYQYPNQCQEPGRSQRQDKKTLVSNLKALRRKTSINLRDNEKVDRNAWLKYKATWGMILSRWLKARKDSICMFSAEGIIRLGNHSRKQVLQWLLCHKNDLFCFLKPTAPAVNRTQMLAPF